MTYSSFSGKHEETDEVLLEKFPVNNYGKLYKADQIKDRAYIH